MAVIETGNPTKCYGHAGSIEDPDLSASFGEIFCFPGPNGCPKTTTIRLLPERPV